MSPRLWPGEKSTIIWSVQPLNPLPVSYLCHCCWWQIGDNKSHKMFIVPGFYPPCFWAECPSREQYPSRPWTRSSVSVRDHPQSSHVAAFIVILSVSVSGSDGGFTRQVRYWVTTWGLSAWPRDLSRITRCSVSLCVSLPVLSVTWDAQVNKDYASKNFEFPHSWYLNFPNEPSVDWNSFADNIVTFQTWHSTRDTVINISGIVQLIQTCCVRSGH